MPEINPVRLRSGQSYVIPILSSDPGHVGVGTLTVYHVRMCMCLHDCIFL